jgi:hypothetical protein
MDTKQRILDEALTLFSEKGYANVFVADIVERGENSIQDNKKIARRRTK